MLEFGALQLPNINPAHRTSALLCSAMSISMLFILLLIAFFNDFVASHVLQAIV